MERHFLKTVPDNAAYEHDYEGADGMPSHIKVVSIGRLSLLRCLYAGGVLQLGT